VICNNAMTACFSKMFAVAMNFEVDRQHTFSQKSIFLADEQDA